MNDQIVSHYRILDELGRGGMGVVYRAEDTRLQRTVALKFLPPELTGDDDAKQRFIQEARAASGLDHPNICTIYEIDESPNGQLFLAMTHYHGETLKERIVRGPLSLTEALDVSMQVAQGLRKAHDAGIVHRDIKPANLFVTTDGIVKILDFGIAKLIGLTQLTRTGTTLGTIEYMAPEQIRGEEADHRADLWALGVVLYEMVTGRRPFRGDRDVAVMHAVLDSAPPPVREAAPGIPSRFEGILMRALAKDRTARYANAAELSKDLAELNTALAEPRRTPAAGVAQMLRRPQVAVPAAAVLLVGLGAAVWAWNRAAGARWAREKAIPEIGQLVDKASYPAAFHLARDAARYVPDDPMLRSLTPLFAATFSVTTTPPGADVYVRRYEGTTEPWQHLGRTPLESIRLARRALRWRIEKKGFETSDLATTNQADHFGYDSIRLTLHEVGTQPPEMVFVPGGSSAGTLSYRTLAAFNLPPFFLDRHEVTNKAFKEFIDAGGYRSRVYWEGLDFIKDGERLPWEDAVARFVDSTGRLGPATWELGAYPDAQDDYPVTGVSWYEAAAYARYRKKTLPTVYHWTKAALPDSEILSSLAASIVPLSNFAAKGPAPVGRYQGIGPYGTYDMHGNVWEWCWNQGVDNQGREGRLVLGGAWDQPDYFYGTALAFSPFERSRSIGFRLLQETGDNAQAARLRERVELRGQRRDVAASQPPSAEVFEAYRRQFAYVRGNPNPSSLSTLESTDHWTKERVTIDVGYGKERMAVYLFIPRNARPPFQPLVYFTGIGPFQIKTPSDDVQPGLSAVVPLDYLVKSGRVLIQPIYQGSYERWSLLDTTNEVSYSRRAVEWRWDLGRTIDYLESRKDIDASRLAFVGVSYGASYALPIVALEPRIKAAVLISGGLPNNPLPPMADPINYLSRITIPVLMVNGRFDYIYPVETSQRPAFNLLGTPAADKRYVILESGHGSPPRNEILRETLGWLDKYLGPVR